MSKFNILHISDIHWSPKNSSDVEIVVSALRRDLERLKSDNKKADIILFTGDLVQSGSDTKHFEKAFETIIKPIIKTCDLPRERVFICPGNHDIDREEIVDFIEGGLRGTLKSASAVNEFADKIKKGDRQPKAAFERLKNYDNFMRLRIHKPPNVLNTSMLQAFRFEVDGAEIGIAMLNTAWRCTGAPNDQDRNLLVIGERNVDDALKALDGCTFKIAAFHHPLDWLADFDHAAVVSLLYSGFDLLAHGHIHRSVPEHKFTTSGSALISQAGSLYNSRDYANSYQIISVDTDTSTATFNLRTFYDSPRREFDAALNVHANGVFVCDIYDQKKLSKMST